MDIKILFDSNSENEKLLTGWGFSCLVDNHILFDTGGNGDALINNMHLMKIDPLSINTIIISHDHDDHTGGLLDFLKINSRVTVYICPHSSENLKKQIESAGAKIFEAKTFKEIKSHVFVTGEILGQDSRGNEVYEQALVLDTQEGISVIVGCSHPGIVDMLKKIKQHFNREKLYFVIGGFHLFRQDENHIQKVVKELEALNIEYISPLHCSGNLTAKLLQESYGERSVILRVGHTICV